uniref:EF-hand domain-containing protein n=1 Tax=Pyrodinium bahamense TaxID=73915 RepID=A0A7S0B1Q9_9DINO|mmetsp:Transcript_46442/g.129212  ORF Transcript_46442/g.129212 Transcript_46442/m.129212 type:complete len:409 (+) Transcript_46442:3-1229(+)
MRCCRRAAVRAHRLVRWPGFDIFVGVIIFLNAICIGAELEYSIQGEDTPMLQAFEYVFLVSYTLELALRGLADGVKCFRDNWIKADAVLLVVGWGSKVLDAIAPGVDGLGPIIIVRSLRLMRFLRAVRMVGRWKTLWKMVSGVMGSAETLASTFITLVFAVYIFTCFSLEIVSISPRLKSDPPANEVVNAYFTNFQATAMTAIQFLTMDDAQDIYRPLVKASPGFAVFFAVVFVLFPILLMNLVTATLVEHAISNSSIDESMKREEIKRKVRELVPRVKNAFRELDDGSGQVHMEDLATANFANMPGLDGVSQILTPQVLVDLWYFFDADDSGFISEEEFVNGVLQLALSETSFEITEVKHLVLANAKNVRALRQAVDRVLVAVTPSLAPGSGATTALPSARSLRTTG